jgi:hypothetical protein
LSNSVEVDFADLDFDFYQNEIMITKENCKRENFQNVILKVGDNDSESSDSYEHGLLNEVEDTELQKK